MNKVLLLVVLIGVCLTYLAAGELTVNISQGRYRGFNFPNGARAFLGLPFAQPPVGELRWRRALPLGPQNSTEVKEALVSGPCCFQSGLFKNLTVAESEDCLTLDIYTPENAQVGDNLPVKVYIHGGGFSANSAAMYPGDELAKNSSSVVVIINYRLSFQGFVVFTPLLEEDNGVVNFGLTDQQLALRWVQENIYAFGGNKDNVLIFGNSAGGMSVLMHYTFPSSNGLFKVGVSQSAGPWDYITAQNAARNNDPRAARFGCNTTNGGVNITCLRQVPMAQFYSFAWSGSQPIIDNLFTGLIAPTFGNKKVMSKSRRGNPIIMGHTQYEGNQFAWLTLRGITRNPNQPLNTTFPIYYAILNSSLPFTENVTREIAAYYSSFAVNGNYFPALREVLGDYGIKCGNIKTAYNAIQGLGKKKVFYYYFNHNTQDWRLTFLNATHTAEIPYVLLTNGTVFEAKFTEGEKALANRVVKYLTNFQNNNKPTQGKKNLPRWPALNANKASTLTWNLVDQVIDMPVPAGCARFWNSLVLDQPVVRSKLSNVFNREKFLTNKKAIKLNVFNL